MESPEKGSHEVPPHPNDEWGRYWWVILILFVLFPIPFGHWWLAVIFLAIFGVIVAVLVKEGKKPPDNP